MRTLDGDWDNTKVIRCVNCKREYAAPRAETSVGEVIPESPNEPRADALRQGEAGGSVDVGGSVWRYQLRHWRGCMKMSLSEASRKIGCTKAHLHSLESGRSANPSITLLLGISSAYGRGLMEVAYYAAGLGEPAAPNPSPISEEDQA